jgi:dTDP-4-amino-4,6-dideoxy-D-galactose acyltransferase
MTPEFHTVFEARKEKLFFYSPYNFIQEIERTKQLSLVKSLLLQAHTQAINISVEEQNFLFYQQFLAWDSHYFAIPTYKLLGILFEKTIYSRLEKAIRCFIDTHLAQNKGYYFIEIPSEDTVLLQALTANKFRLIETRLTYFRGNLANFDTPQRYAVRKANEKDTFTLKEVARNTRNSYDRLHADTSFSIETADEYLATYIENAIKGFADIVLVPDDKNYPCEAFLTANYLAEEWATIGKNISKMVLLAVAPSCKGWHQKLVTEMTYHLRDKGAAYIFINTQSTNRAVFKVWERLGYQLGSTSHILVFQNF